MDAYTRNHLAAWADYTLHDHERESVVKAILDIVASDPNLLADHSWPEIRSLAESEGLL